MRKRAKISLAAVDSENEDLGSHNSQNLPSHGLISSLRLVNFMCHDNLLLEFGPNVNFIVGQNGSGKSAVLTALMLVLGASAAKTQRGHKISSFIKHDRDHAIITLVLNNLPSLDFDSYQPHVFGNQIVVERRIQRDMSSSFAIKSAAGVKVGHKKDLVCSICRHFRIQVDNPMTILTQDVAKNYLASSSDIHKYEFFEKGTFLQQLKLDYQSVNDKKQAMEVTLCAAEKDISRLEAELEHLQFRLTELNAIRDSYARQDNLRVQLAWSLVRDLQQDMDTSSADLERLQLKLRDLDNDSGNAILQTLHEEHKNLLDQLEQLRQKRSIFENSKSKLSLEAQSSKRNIGELELSRSQAQADLVLNESSLNGLLNRIKDEGPSADPSFIKTLQEEIEAMNSAIAAKSNEIAELNHEKERFQEKMEICSAKISSSRSTLHDLNTGVDRHKSQLLHLSRAQHENQRIYGEGVPKLLDHLKQTQVAALFKEKPIGPLGLYVTLKDTKWKYALEAIIGRFMANFIVFTYEDREVLQSFMKKFGCTNQIILKRHYIGQFREPPAGFLTAYRVCDFGDRSVADVLCILSNFERLLLCNDRKEAMEFLTDASYGSRGLPNADAAFTIDAAKVTNSDSSQTYFSYGASKTCRYFDNLETQVRQATLALENDTSKLRATQEELTSFNDSLKKLKSEAGLLNAKLSAFHEERSELMSLVGQKQGALELEAERISDVALFSEQQESDVENFKKKIARLRSQLGQMTNRDAELVRNHQSIIAEIASIDEQLRALDSTIADVTVLLEELLGKLGSVDNSKRKREQRKQKLEEDIASAEHHRQKLVERYSVAEENARGLAEEPPDNINDRPKTETIRRELEALVKFLANQSINPEDITNLVATVTLKREKLAASKDTCGHWRSYLSRLCLAVKGRYCRLVEFRRLISIQSQLYFCFFMSHRGFNGKLLFDHEMRSLKISVAIAEDSSGSYDGKEVKTLSGGEKSVATTCFLLALWNSMESKLRCLDEFDVFMDQVNRDTILKMLLEFAKSAFNTSSNMGVNNSASCRPCNSAQYIFITPQVLSLDATSLAGAFVKILKMRDPIRD